MKLLTILFFAALFLLMGCNGEAGPSSNISAQDYNTRLTNMRFSLNAEELSEISTGIIGASKGYFEGLGEWYLTTGLLDREVLRLQTVLDGREARVVLTLGDDGVVTQVQYNFEHIPESIDDIIDSYSRYIPFDFVGENVRITTTVDGRSIELEDDAAAAQMLAEAIYYGSALSVIRIWDYVNSFGDAASITFSFSYQDLVLNHVTFEMITFRLR